MSVMSKNTEVAPSDSDQWGLACLGKLCKDGRARRGQYMKGRLVERDIVECMRETFDCP